MLPSASAATPKRGDVVVKRASDGSPRFILTTLGAVPQVACATQQEAVAQADRFARMHHVDVWHTDDGRTLTRILEARLEISV